MSAWEWAQVALLIGNLGWTTLCLGGYRAETMVVTAALTGGLLVVHLASRVLAVARDEQAGGRAVASAHPAGWLLVPFLVYALANVLWVAPSRWLGWMDWLGWAQMVAVFWVVVNGIRGRAARRAVLLTLVTLAVGGVFLACYQRFVNPDWAMLGRTQLSQYAGRASGAFGIPNSFAGSLVLLFPVAAALTLRSGAGATERVGWGWVSVVLAFGLVLTLSRGAWIALSVALAMWPLANSRWSWKCRVAGVLAVLVSVAVVAVAIHRASPRVRERTAALVQDAGEKTRPIVWLAAVKLFREEPLLGTGAGSYNVLFERYRPEGFRDEPQWAHNDYLNTLSDYGLVGFGLFFGACIVMTVRSARSPIEDAGRRTRHWLDARDTRLGMGVGLLAFALHLALEFHLKMPALALTWATVGGLAVSRGWEARGGAPVLSARVIRIGGAVIAGGVACLVWIATGWYRSEAARAGARELIDGLGKERFSREDERGRLGAALIHLERAVVLGPANGQAWADLAYAYALASRMEGNRDAEFGRKAEVAAERALASMRGNYEFWVRRGVARAMQGRWAEADDDFAQAVKLAPKNALAWYYQAECFSRRRATIQLAEISLGFCLRLDPWSGPGLALRQRLAIGGTPQ